MKVIQYVYFEKKGEFEQLEKLAEKAVSISDFMIRIRDAFDMQILDAKVVAEKYWNKLKQK